MKSEYSSGGVVIRKEHSALKVLLIKDIYGRWTWPKGHIEEKETQEETCVREIEEEVGLKKIKVLRKLGEQHYSFERASDRIKKTVHVFLVLSEVGESVRIQRSEVADAVWYSPSEAEKIADYEGAAGFIHRAVELFRKEEIEEKE